MNLELMPDSRSPKMVKNMLCITARLTKIKPPRVLCDQKICEDNQKLRPGCPPDYQIFCERIDPKYFSPTNLSSYLSLTKKNSSMRTSTKYM